MTETAKLISDVETFLARVPMAETTFGLKAVNDGKFMRRLRSGGSVTLEKASQVRQYMRANKKWRAS